MNLSRTVKSKLIFSSFLLATSFAMHTNAEPVASIGYYKLNSNSLELGIIGGTIGYKFDFESTRLSLTPELRMGLGVKDDTVNVIGIRVDYDLDYMWSINLRGQWDINNSSYLFINPTYNKFSLDIGSPSSFSFTESGIGAGIGFKLTESTGIELGYEDLDDKEMFNFTLRRSF